MKIKKNIVAALFMTAILVGVAYLSIGVKNEADYKIKSISLSGNVHLTKDNYLRFAGLLDKSGYDALTLQIIKDRLEKHPYIESADVRFSGGNSVDVVLNEKEFHSLLIGEEEQYIITEKLELLPLLDETNKIDYPVISNAGIGKSVKVLSSVKKYNDVMTALKIVDAVKLANPDLQDALSTVDLNNGGDIRLYFSNTDYPVIIGRGSEVRRVIYYCDFWNSLKGKEVNNYMEYVDMRYGGHIFLGIIEPAEIMEEKS